MKTAVHIMTLGYILLCLACVAALYIPWPEGLSLVPTVLEFIPGILLVAPGLIVLVLVRGTLTRWMTAVALALATLFFFEFQVPILKSGDDPGIRIRIATYNIGNGPVDPKKLLSWFRNTNLDALLLQETQSLKLTRDIPAGLNYVCGGRLCVLTQHRIKKLQNLNRQAFEGGWGSYVARFDLEIAGIVLGLYNVHLNTPRHELEFIRGRVEGVKKAARLYTLRKLESQLASAMVEQHPQQRSHVIIAGDFNLAQRGAIYRSYWSEYTNAFDEAGLGLGATKETRLLGARIDHILVNDQLQVNDAAVMESLGGDHNPLVVELTLL
ncbi:MAG: endonuclease/exonuclease/phosphatase family protein [Pseudomonadota bacterium]